MKKTVGILILIAALMLSACSGVLPGPKETEAKPGQTEQPTETQSAAAESTETQPAETEPQGIPDIYAAILDAYARAGGEGWNHGTMVENGLNYMAVDIFGDNPGENLGYGILDLDGDGVQELLIGATERVTDPFYGRMALELYTLDAHGSAVTVFTGWERNRYYYLGDNLFANIGSSSASDSVDTTLSLENGALKDLGYATAPEAYAPMPLTPIGSWQPSEPELYLPILDEINEITRVGTTGAYLTAVQAAAKLLDWASGTGLDPLEVKDATVRWLQNQGEDAQQEIRQKLEQVDNAIRDLLGENAEDLLSSAGCGNTGYPWDEYPLAYIEAIMEAIGLR